MLYRHKAEVLLLVQKVGVMKYKIIIFLLFSAVAFGQFTSDHTGEHIDSVITSVGDLAGWLTPEMYGASGFPINDTEAIQDVMQAGVDQGKMVVFRQKYKYSPTSGFMVDSVCSIRADRYCCVC